MRVVMLIGSARIGGAEGQLVQLACHLQQRQVDVRVLFGTAAGPLTARLDEAGVAWEVMRRGLAWTRAGRALVGLLWTAQRFRTWQPDIVFTWLPGTAWYAVPMARVLTGARTIVAFRGEVFECGLGWMARPFRWAVRRADAVTINAPALLAEACRWGADQRRVTFVANGVDMSARQADVERQPPTAVVVANFRWYKGHDVLAEALTRVNVPVQVRLLGEGSELEPTRKRMSALGVLDKVTFVDRAADVQAELLAAQFAIHPSRAEGLPNAVLEQLAVGLPVVATDAGGTSLLVQDDVTGHLVPIGDPDALAACVTRMAESSDLRKRLSDCARLKAGQFSWESSTRRYVELFASLLNQERR